MRSKVLQDVITLLAGHPVRGPAGFYAGPVLQQAVIFGHFGVTTSRKPEKERQKKLRRVLRCEAHYEWRHLPEAKGISDIWKDNHISHGESPR